MTLRRNLVVGIAIAILGVIALLLAGSRPVMVRQFALRAANRVTAALIRPQTRVCEGPVTTPAPIQAVGIWGGSVVGISRLMAEVRDAGTGRTLSTGRIDVTAGGEQVARLANTVPAGRSLSICLVGTLNTFALQGPTDVQSNVAIAGSKPAPEFSLVLLNDRKSLLGSLPTAFERASLWRPSWVGPCTFWVLVVALLATFGLGVAAVASAATEDEVD